MMKTPYKQKSVKMKRCSEFQVKIARIEPFVFGLQNFIDIPSKELQVPRH